MTGYADCIRRPLDRHLWLVVLVALVLRVAAVLVLGDYHSPLSAEYGMVAENLAAGLGYVGGGWFGPPAPTALNTPLYPLLLAAWLRLAPALPYLGVQLTQAMLSALTTVAIWKLARRLVREGVALLAALATVIYPPLIYYCAQISPAILNTLLATLAFSALWDLIHATERKATARRGALIGLALLADPALVPALGMAALVWWAIERASWRALLPRATLAAGASLLVLLPWIIRNALVFGRFIPFKTSFGLNLYLGNNPHATGYLYTAAGVPMQDTLSANSTARLVALDEASRYVLMGDWARAWIRGNLAQFFALCWRRLSYFWIISPTVAVLGLGMPRWQWLLRISVQLALLAGATVGVALSVRHRRALLGLLAGGIGISLPYVAAVAGNTRYRMPIEPLLIILAAYAVVRIAEALGVTENRQAAS